MSDLLNLASQAAPAQPIGTPLPARPLGLSEPTEAATDADALAPLQPFDALLAAVVPELSTDDATLTPDAVAEDTLAPVETTSEAYAMAAQQFMASLLVNPLPDLAANERVESLAAISTQPSVTAAAPAAPVVSPMVKAEELPVAPVKTAETSAPDRQPAAKNASPMMMTKTDIHTAMTTPHSGVPLQMVSAHAAQTTLNVPLRLDGATAEMPQQLQHALGERLNLQVNNQIQHATIRLDPPDMGKIEISLHFEAGKLQVQINAGQGDVYRALQQVSNDLRQALTEQHFVDVDVQVSSQSAQQQQRQDKQQEQQGETPTAILANDTESRHASERRSDDSILMTI